MQRVCVFLRWAAVMTAVIAVSVGFRTSQAEERPNILWLTIEDASCNLGCYGDTYADTPNLDRLAAEGVRYTQAFGTASVCTPCRSTLITGMYPVSLGSQHLRSEIRLPEEIPCFPALLRKAGYYCTNNVKEDYNFRKPPGVWDESSNTAHWRHRQPGQPFFAVFNCMMTHQSRVRMPEDEFAKETAPFEPFAHHDPDTVPLPPYFPDTPGFRKEMARFYDQMSAADAWAAHYLKQLEEDGLADDTIVFFYSDHGSGIPRHKRALYDSGVRVPLIIRFPEKYRHLAPGKPGSAIGRLVSFVDFAPTVLSLAGAPIPETMQGKAFLGPAAAPPRKYVYLIRDRVDEVFEMSRGVRNRRFKYIRNFMPHRPYMDISEYCEPALMVRDWRRLAKEGSLHGARALYMQPVKPIEELYDLEADPDELHNLAGDPQYESVRRELHDVLIEFMISRRDTGLLPEGDMFRRAGEDTIFAMAQDDDRFPVAEIAATADLVGRPEVSLEQLIERTHHDDPAVRYWAVTAMMAPEVDASAAKARLHELLSDDSPEVRIVAAEALCRMGDSKRAVSRLARELRSSDEYVRLQAAATLAQIGSQAEPALDSILEVITEKGSGDHHMFTQWALARCLRQLGVDIPPSVPILY